MENIVVNIVVVTYNRWDYSEQCLPNIRETASDKIPYTITVVDNGSSDGTPEKLKEMYKDGIIDNLVLLKENIGVAKAQNIGWQLNIDAPYYAKIDNDVLFEKKGWLDGVINTFTKSTGVGALGYQCTEDNANYPISSENGVSYRVKNGNIGGACFFVPKHVNEELGFWCEDFGKYGEEDADYGMRITVSSRKNCYMVDRTIMKHLPEKDKEYRKFKDDERDENMKGDFWKMIGEYKSGQRPLKIDSNILEQLEYIGEIVK